MSRALPWLAALAAASAIGSATGGLPHALLYLAKPLATILILAWARPRGASNPRAQRLVRLGLALSLIGDVALLWPREGFLPGLVAFLLAHLAYIGAFCTTTPFAARRLPFVAYTAVAGAILALLWPGVPGALRLPVLADVACLAAMAAQAAAAWLGARGTSESARAWRAALGGALFVASDALLATNRFSVALPLAALWILATYWAAQGLIAASLAPGNR